MAPKKNSRSALYFYAKEKMEQSGARTTINEAIEQFYAEWKALSTSEKMPYERKYEDWKSELKHENAFNVSSKSSIKGDLYVDPFIEQAGTRNDQVKDIKAMLARIDTNNNNSNDSKTSINETIKNQKFYMIKFNTFCKADSSPYSDFQAEPYYVLAEVGLVEYSLSEGITNTYHAFTQPAKVPLGYRSQCIDSTRDIHQIPLEVKSDEFKHVRRSDAAIYSDIIDFLSNENNNPVLLFSLSKDIEETRFGLRFLEHQAYKEELDFKPINKVYELECLANVLAFYGKHELAFGSALDLLTSYTYDYTANTRCDFHEELGTIHCALGVVKRYSYLISDSICQMYNIKITDNHIPMQKQVGTLINNENFKIMKGFSSDRSSFGYGGKQSLKKEPSFTDNYRSSSNNLRNRMEAGGDESDTREEFDFSGFSNANRSGTTGSNLSLSKRANSSFDAFNNSNKMPAVDIRLRDAAFREQNMQQQQQTQQQRRRLEKFESSILSSTNATNFSTVNSQSMKREHTSEAISDITSSAAKSLYSDFDEVVMADDDSEWTTVNQRKPASKRVNDETDNQSSVSGSTKTNVSTNVESSSIKSYYGRGRIISRK